MQYYWRYIEGVVAPPGVAMIEGTSVHDTIHENLIYKRERGLLLDEEYIADLAADRLKTNWLKEEPALNDDEKQLGETIVKAKSIDRVVALAKLHAVRLAPVIRPRSLERKFTITLEGYPFDLSGIIDIQEENGTIRDSKTTRKTPTQALADRALDFDVYHFAATYVEELLTPTRLFFDYMIGQKKTYRVESIETTRDVESHKLLLRRVENATKVIEAEAFTPTDPNNWVCSKAWCGYFQMCPFGERRRTMVGQAGVEHADG